jgi:hypothetical protein
MWNHVPATRPSIPVRASILSASAPVTRPLAAGLSMRTTSGRKQREALNRLVKTQDEEQ